MSHPDARAELPVALRVGPQGDVDGHVDLDPLGLQRLQMLGDVEDFARRRPWLTGAIGVAVGFIAARFVNANADRVGTRMTEYRTASPPPVRPAGYEAYSATPLAPPVSPDAGL